VLIKVKLPRFATQQTNKMLRQRRQLSGSKVAWNTASCLLHLTQT